MLVSSCGITIPRYILSFGGAKQNNTPTNIKSSIISQKVTGGGVDLCLMGDRH